MDFALDIDFADVHDGIDGMKERLEHGKPFFTELKTEARADVRERSKARQGPNGETWVPRATSTVERSKRKSERRRRKGRTAGLLGQVGRPSKAEVSDFHLDLSSHASFAMVHQTGGVVGHGARLPARPYLGWTEEFMTTTAESWRAWVLEGWRP